MATESNWTAIPDLLLTLIPTIILLTLVNETGKGLFNRCSCLERIYLVTLSVLLAVSGYIELFRRPGSRYLALLGSLVYSSLFPFTVVVGGSHCLPDAESCLSLHFSIACATVLIYLYNPSPEQIAQCSPIISTFGSKLYFPVQLYLAVFGAISETASTSFNFEENSLISQGVTHLLVYVLQVPLSTISFHEVFLPSLTFGLMLSISPTIPFLRDIKTSKDRMRPLTISAAIFLTSIVLGIRPWLVDALDEDPIIWVLKYMLWSEGYQTRLIIVSWWLAVLAFGIFVPIWFFTGSDGQDNGESLNKRRKFFHGIVVLLFIPSLCLDVLSISSVFNR